MKRLSSRHCFTSPQKRSVTSSFQNTVTPVSLTPSKTEAQKRAFAKEMKQREIDRLAPLIPRAIVKGLDPGRVNLYMTATKSDDGSHERRFYSRKRHLERSGRNRMQAWRDKRTSLPLVSDALKALSLSAGAHGCDASKWTVYMSARRVHRTVLWNEFMYNDERCKKRMVEYRLGQRALARAADHLVSEGILQKKPVIIGYGTGRGNGGGHKGEPSVPVKAMYRALKIGVQEASSGGRHTERLGTLHDPEMPSLRADNDDKRRTLDTGGHRERG